MGCARVVWLCAVPFRGMWQKVPIATVHSNRPQQPSLAAVPSNQLFLKCLLHVCVGCVVPVFPQVMGLVGKSLSAVRKELSHHRFSPFSVCEVGLQTLAAIRHS